MVIRNINGIEDLNEDIRSLTIDDPKASLAEINQLLEQVVILDYLRIDSQIATLPDDLERLQLKSLIINAKQSDFVLNAALIPSSLELIYIWVRSVDRIPDRFWALPEFKIQAKNLKNQNFANASGHKNLRYALEIDDLEELPIAQAKKVTIKCKFLNVVPSSFFDVNRNSLDALSLHCKLLNGMIAAESVLSSLTFCSIHTEAVIDGRELSFLPDSLSYLSLRAKRFDFNFERLSKLTTLYLDGLATSELVINASGLNSLSISNANVDVFGDIKTPNLTVLYVSNSVAVIPDFIYDCTMLDRVSFTNNPLVVISKSWSSMINLRSVYLRDNLIYFDAFNFLDGLKKLKSVDVSGNSYRDKYVFLTKKAYPFSHLGLASLFGCSESRIGEILKFAPALAKAKMDETLRKRFFDAYIHNSDLLPFINESKENLVAAFQINHRPLKLVLSSKVDEMISKKSGIDYLQGAKVYIDGKIKLSVAEVKSKLVDQGASLLKSLTKDVSHILLGDKPSKIGSFNENLLYISESDLAIVGESEKFINVQVNSGNTALITKVKSFLLSPDSANVAVGLQMLSSGGVNENVFPVLLTIAKAHNDAKVRKSAKQLLELHGPKQWSPLLSNKLLFKNLNGKVREQEINNKLESIQKEIGIDLACELSLALYERFEKGLRFMVTRSNYPVEYTLRMYDLICYEGHLSLDKAMGFKSWKDKDPSEIIFNTHKAKLSLPVAILDHKKVVSIGLHNTKITSIPRDLTKFRDLKRVDLSCNNISKIPASFTKMDSIEELDLSLNIFEAFPDALMEMKGLSKVDLRHNREKGFMGKFSPLEAPKEGREGTTFYC